MDARVLQAVQFQPCALFLPHAEQSPAARSRSFRFMDALLRDPRVFSPLTYVPKHQARHRAQQPRRTPPPKPRTTSRYPKSRRASRTAPPARILVVRLQAFGSRRAAAGLPQVRPRYRAHAADVRSLGARGALAGLQHAAILPGAARAALETARGGAALELQRCAGRHTRAPFAGGATGAASAAVVISAAVGRLAALRRAASLIPALRRAGRSAASGACRARSARRGAAAARRRVVAAALSGAPNVPALAYLAG